jgi:hypothetical protein
MNWQRGLLRLWLVLSVIWIIVVGWSENVRCAFGALSVWWGCHGYGRDPYAWESAWPTHVVVFGVPLAILVIGACLFWAMNGFKSN